MQNIITIPQFLYLAYIRRVVKVKYAINFSNRNNNQKHISNLFVLFHVFFQISQNVGLSIKLKRHQVSISISNKDETKVNFIFRFFFSEIMNIQIRVEYELEHTIISFDCHASLKENTHISPILSFLAYVLCFCPIVCEAACFRLLSNHKLSNRFFVFLPNHIKLFLNHLPIIPLIIRLLRHSVINFQWHHSRRLLLSSDIVTNLVNEFIRTTGNICKKPSLIKHSRKIGQNIFTINYS